MTDLSQTIEPKSDQLNADDLIAGDRIVTITRVTGQSGDQPISVFFDGDNGKPYKPCKSMRRVLVMVWGKDGNAYAGRSMTLYNDPEVKFGGIAVGGIRISHMSHIDSDVKLMLTTTRGKKSPYHVRMLQQTAPTKSLQAATKDNLIQALAVLEIAPSIDALKRTAGDLKKERAWSDEQASAIKFALDARAAELKAKPRAAEDGAARGPGEDG